MANRSAACRFASSALILALLLVGRALAAPAGEVTHVSGALMVLRVDGSSKILAPQSQIEPGDLLATATNTFARVRFTDGSEVTLRPNTQLRIEAFLFDPNNGAKDSSVMNLLKGGLRAVTGVIARRNPNTYQMRTIVATIGVRGTHFGLLYCANDCQTYRTNGGEVPKDGLHLDVSQGLISVANTGGEKLLSAGQFGYTQNGTVPMVLVSPAQGVTNNMPSFQGTSGSNALECVVQ